MHIALYGDRIELETPVSVEGLPQVMPFDCLSAVTVLGRNKVNLYWEDRVYQLKGDARFNALRYVNLFYRAKNISEGNEHVEFLGL